MLVFSFRRRTIIVTFCILLLIVFGFILPSLHHHFDFYSFVSIEDKHDGGNRLSTINVPKKSNNGDDDDDDDDDYIPDIVLCANITTTTTNDKKTEVEELTPPPPPPRDHPHAGARHCNGSWGYVADVTAPRKWMRQQWRTYIQQQTLAVASSKANNTANIDYYNNYYSMERHNNKTKNVSSNFMPMTEEEFENICQTPPGEGFEGKGGWELSTNKVQVNGPDPYFLLQNQSSKSWAKPEKPLEKVGKPPRILCIVYTYPKKHNLILAAIASWGHRCDGFLAASTLTIPEYGIVDLPHKGNEEYNNMWQKVRSIWAYVYDNYVDDFDYFHIGGDDTHTIVENLRNFLWSVGGGRDTGGGPNPLYLGTPTRRKGFYVNGGGAGYTLNQVALRSFVQKALPKCMAAVHSSAEDRFVGRCLHGLGIKGDPTWDAFGQNRYHGMDPNGLYTCDLTLKRNQHWKEKYAFHEKRIGKPMGEGLDRASSQSVSFHLFKTPERLKRHHAILYRSCPRGTVLGDALSAIDDGIE